MSYLTNPYRYAAEPIDPDFVWTNLKYMTVNGDNSVTATGGSPPHWRSLASSTNKISTGVKITCTTDALFAGFALNTTQNPSSVYYAQYFTQHIIDAGTNNIYEQVTAGSPFDVPALDTAFGDLGSTTFGIAYNFEGTGGITYLKNDVVAYTTTASPSGDYYFNISCEQSGTTSTAIKSAI